MHIMNTLLNHTSPAIYNQLPKSNAENKFSTVNNNFETVQDLANKNQLIQMQAMHYVVLSIGKSNLAKLSLMMNLRDDTNAQETACTEKKDTFPLQTHLNSTVAEKLNEDILAKLKSEKNIQYEVYKIKSQRFTVYFKEALATNGQDVQKAIEQAKIRLKTETDLSDEELLSIVNGLAVEYECDKNSLRAQKIAYEITQYAQNLEDSIKKSFVQLSFEI